MVKESDIIEIKSILKEMRSLIKEIRSVQKAINSVQKEILALYHDKSLYLNAVKVILTQQKILEKRIEQLEWDLQSYDESMN